MKNITKSPGYYKVFFDSFLNPLTLIVIDKKKLIINEAGPDPTGISAICWYILVPNLKKTVNYQIINSFFKSFFLIKWNRIARQLWHSIISILRYNRVSVITCNKTEIYQLIHNFQKLVMRNFIVKSWKIQCATISPLFLLFNVLILFITGSLSRIVQRVKILGKKVIFNVIIFNLFRN